MTGERRFEQQLPNALADLAMTPYPAYIDDVLQITARTPRRPAWQFPSRWLPFATTLGAARVRTRQLRPVIVLALVILVIAALIAVYIGSQRLPDPYGLAANGKVAFSSDHAAWVLNENGTTRLLLDLPGDEFQLTYSLDGTRIAFILAPGDGKEYLWAADGDGSHPIPILAEPIPPGVRIVWSPDSRRVVVSAKVDGIDRVIVVETDGSGSTTLDLPFPARNPVWRPPDGRELAIRGEVDGHAQLFVVAADGSSVQKIGPQGLGLFLEERFDLNGAAWSPDGSRLAYNSIDAAPGARGDPANGDYANDLRFQVHVIEPDGTNRVIGGPDIDVMESWPLWSPDGSLITLQRWRWDGLAWLGIVPSDGSGPGLDVELKTHFQGEIGWDATWSPDGTRILAFWDGRGAVMIDVATGAFEPVDQKITSWPSWQRKAP